MFDDILFPKKDVYLPEDVEECKACMGSGHDLYFEPCPVCGGAGEVPRADNGFACMISLQGRMKRDMVTGIDEERSDEVPRHPGDPSNTEILPNTRIHPCRERAQQQDFTTTSDFEGRTQGGYTNE